MSSNNQHYEGDLQRRLRNLSIRTNCPTRQENGQRYLGPPVNWTDKPPVNSEVFISKLPSDCFEDEIYNFCSQVGKIYLIRLMINFENENRGFCFVTFSNSKEATGAVSLLPLKQLRKGHYVHAEISLNNCTLKMYGLDFRWSDEELEQEIRMNTKDVINVTIKRNMAHRTLMATLYFDTHQKAAIARRKLSQIANSRWGQNVKVFLWSKKLQNRSPNKQEYTSDRNIMKSKYNYATEGYFPTKLVRNIDDLFATEIRKEDTMNLNQNMFKEESVAQGNSGLQQWINQSKLLFNFDQNLPVSNDESFDFEGKYNTENEMYVKHSSYDLNNNHDSFDTYDDIKESYDPFGFPCISPKSDFSQFSSPTKYCTVNDHQQFSLFPLSNESSPAHSKSSLSDTEPYLHFSTNTFVKSEQNLLDLASPLDYSPEICKNTPNTYFQDNQIEIILKEALEALNKNILNEN